jgi:hypothetical protein
MSCDICESVVLDPLMNDSDVEQIAYCRVCATQSVLYKQMPLIDILETDEDYDSGEFV